MQHFTIATLFIMKCINVRDLAFRLLEWPLFHCLFWHWFKNVPAAHLVKMQNQNFYYLHCFKNLAFFSFSHDAVIRMSHCFFVVLTSSCFPCHPVVNGDWNVPLFIVLKIFLFSCISSICDLVTEMVHFFCFENLTVLHPIQLSCALLTAF